MKFPAADGPRGGGQRPDRCADAHGEKISQHQRGEDDHRHEFQRLRVEFVDARVAARFFQAALRHHRPSQVRDRAVSADHLRILAVFNGVEMLNGFRGAQILRNQGHLRHDVRRRAQVRTRNDLPGVGMHDYVPVVIHDENRAAPHAGFLQAAQDSVQRDHRGQHAVKLAGYV